MLNSDGNNKQWFSMVKNSSSVIQWFLLGCKWHSLALSLTLMAFNRHRLLHLNMFYEVNIAKDICEHMVAHATVSVTPTPNQYSDKRTQPQML